MNSLVVGYFLAKVENNGRFKGKFSAEAIYYSLEVKVKEI